MNFNEETFAKIVDSLHDGLYFVDRDRCITYWNKAAERITGYTAAEVVGRSCSDNILTHVDADGNHLCSGVCPLAATIADGTARSSEIYLHHKDGHRIPISVRTSTLTDTTGSVIGGIELFTDISSQAVSQLRIRELEKMALIDKLTELPNRRYLEKELHNKFEEKKRLNFPFGILFIDIDHFKKFNDTYGHDVGDRVLACVARTFTANSRPFDIYGRWGGEEFIGILHIATGDDMEHLADRLRMLVENSYIMHEGNRLIVTVSIGATILRDDDTIESLLKRADSLLYKSKQAGRNRYSFGP
jgi:diguanylate cyclase (GGDEF)-like protein/PAS domain S-box-containing protein